MSRGAIIICLIIICPLVSAELTYFQRPPQNDPLEYRVHQGDTIYQGKTYDLSGVYGLSGQFAFWKDWKSENQNCKPDMIIDIHYYNTRINKTAVLVDWPKGNWYYWDGDECNISYYDYSQLKTVYRNAPLDHDNKFAFTVTVPKSYPVGEGIVSVFNPVKGYESVYES